MPSTLQADLRQKKPFTSLEEEAFLNVVRTAATLGDRMDELLRSRGVSGTQYNALRILRGAEASGLCRNELRDRMVTRMPDVTRLLDRMEQGGLVRRSREGGDRRMVLTQLSEKGRRLVDELDAPVKALHRQTLGHLSSGELRSLSDLLTRARSSG